jgi:hypothetical protein
VKNVGKPCDREGHARIDGGRLETGHLTTDPEKNGLTRKQQVTRRDFSVTTGVMRAGVRPGAASAEPGWGKAIP